MCAPYMMEKETLTQRCRLSRFPTCSTSAGAPRYISRVGFAECALPSYDRALGRCAPGGEGGHGRAALGHLLDERQRRDDRVGHPTAVARDGVDDLAVRILDGLRLKAPAKRLFDRAPGWMRQLNTREIRTRPRLVDADLLTARFVEALRLLAANHIEVGDYLEFGVFNGTSMCCMHRALNTVGNRHSRLIGFDSFEGLPEVAARDSAGHWRPGDG